MNNRSPNTLLLSFYILVLGVVLYNYVPNIVFYFDQEAGTAEITMIRNKNVILKYEHKELKKNVKVSFREGNAKKLRRLNVEDILEIKYSRTFPSRVSILSYDKKPGLGGFILVLLCLIPIVFIKNIK